jgi:hypothetical protein
VKCILDNLHDEDDDLHQHQDQRHARHHTQVPSQTKSTIVMDKTKLNLLSIWFLTKPTKSISARFPNQIFYQHGKYLIKSAINMVPKL